MHAFSRTEQLIGREGLQRLKEAKVAVFGIGGVGSFTVEALARAGVGKLVLVDDDVVCLTNLNRQLHATWKTLGRPKVEVMRDRILDINPHAEVEIQQRFYLPECGADMVRKDFDYIVDAIDTVTAKVDLIVRAREAGIPIISCMGAGNKMDPTRFEVADLAKTSVCPLARVMRRELKQRDVVHLKVVYSKEEAVSFFEPEDNDGEEAINLEEATKREGTFRPGAGRKQPPGSISFVPSVAGLILAGEVIKDLIGWKR